MACIIHRNLRMHRCQYFSFSEGIFRWREVHVQRNMVMRELHMMSNVLCEGQSAYRFFGQFEGYCDPLTATKRQQTANTALPIRRRQGAERGQEMVALYIPSSIGLAHPAQSLVGWSGGGIGNASSGSEGQVQGRDGQQGSHRSSHALRIHCETAGSVATALATALNCHGAPCT